MAGPNRRPRATTKQVATAATGQVRSPLATTEQVAEYLGISVPALLQLRYLGKAPKATKVGTRLRWKWEDVDAYIEQGASSSSRA